MVWYIPGSAWGGQFLKSLLRLPGLDARMGCLCVWQPASSKPAHAIEFRLEEQPVADRKSD